MKNRFSIKEVMEITGLSKRTLHYYDEIGLLKPEKKPENKYREYSEQDLISLSKIILLKSLDLDLKDIKELKHLNNSELRSVLEPHQILLRDKIENLIRIEKNLSDFIKGKPEYELEIFDKPVSERYEKEAEIKYGDTEAYKSFKKKSKNSNGRNRDAEKAMSQVFQKFNELQKTRVPYADAGETVNEWKQVSLMYADFTDDVLCMIAAGYSEDPRFEDYFKVYDNKELTEYIKNAVKHHLGK